MTPNPEGPMQQPSWFSRNWKWLLPVGCVLPMMCCGVFGLGAYLAVSKIIQPLAHSPSCALGMGAGGSTHAATNVATRIGNELLLLVGHHQSAAKRSSAAEAP